MKRKQSLFSCLFFSFLFNFGVFAQEIAPFQSLEPQAIEITSSILSQVLDKTWHCTTRKYVEKKRYVNRSMGRNNLTISADGLFNHNGLEGSWYIENEKLIVLEIEREEFEESKNAFLIGGFSILKVAEHELILRKTLTSNFDSEFTYFLESDERFQLRNKNSIVQFNISHNSAKKYNRWGEEIDKEPVIEKAVKTLDPYIQGQLDNLTQNLSKEELLHIIKAEFKLRNIAFDNSLQKLSEIELREKLNNLNKN